MIRPYSTLEYQLSCTSRRNASALVACGAWLGGRNQHGPLAAGRPLKATAARNAAASRSRASSRCLPAGATAARWIAGPSMAGWIPPSSYYGDRPLGITEVGNGGKTGNPFSRNAGQSWNRLYPGGTGIESFADIERARRHRQLPQNCGVVRSPRRMDRFQTREVKGHPEGKLSITYTSPRFDGTGGRWGIDHASVERPVPVPAVRREIGMFRAQIEAEQWQITDKARGKLPKCGGSSRPNEPPEHTAGVPAFWRSHASRPYSIEELTRRCRTNSGRRALAREASYSSSARGAPLSATLAGSGMLSGGESTVGDILSAR